MMEDEKDTAQAVVSAEQPEPVAGDTITKLAAMSDVELASVLGYAQQLDNAKTQITALSQMKGEGRVYAEKRISDMLTPRVHDLNWIVEDAERKNKKKDFKSACNDCSPCSVL